jgi:hypothetical protein
VFADMIFIEHVHHVKGDCIQKQMITTKFAGKNIRRRKKKSRVEEKRTPWHMGRIR